MATPEHIALSGDAGSPSKAFLKSLLPVPLYNCLRILRNWKDVFPVTSFLFSRSGIPIREKCRIIRQIYVITLNVKSPHTQGEVLAFMREILSLKGRGVIVEAGCYKGSSTAKFSLACAIAGRKLIVFDSFEGIPANDEPHDRNIFGGVAEFKQGSFCGTLDEVKANVERYGNIECCEFVKGWFDDTMPEFDDPVATAYIDVDLASSTRTSLKHLYPLLDSGGRIYSQDGHLPLVLEVFDDDRFWSGIGYDKPLVHGLGKSKLISIVRH